MDIIDKYITLITFIPWILIYIVSILKNIRINEYHNFSFKYLKNNFFSIFRMDILVLIIFFYFFASFKKEFVNKYLFPVMCFYLFVNSFYDKGFGSKKIKISKKYLLELIFLFLVMLVPFIFYFKTRNLDLTYKIMLFYIFLNYFIILIISYGTLGIRYLFRKIKKG